MLDQHFWAKQIEKVGAGINCGSFYPPTSRKLENKIKQLLQDKKCQKTTKKISQNLKAENGAKTAADLICAIRKDPYNAIKTSF